MSSHAVRRPIIALDRDWIVAALDKAFLYGTVVLIPYDLPLVHQACLPLALLGAALLVLRGDQADFLAYMRRLPVSSALTLGFCVIAVLSLYLNLNVILASKFQNESGWTRGVVQGALLLVTSVYPFYFAFCLRRHADWQVLITRAAWLSAPIPLFVGMLQLANMLGVPHLSHLPYVGGAYEASADGSYKGGFLRVTSVAREASWFASYVCVVLPFLLLSVLRDLAGWRKQAGGVAIGIMLLLFALGFSKSSFAGLGFQILAALAAISAVRPPWRIYARLFFGLVLLCAVMFTMATITPGTLAKLTRPFVDKAQAVYYLFEPLLLGDTKMVSIGTRFGMSAAGIAMGETHPVAGVGLGQFGFHANNYTPLWGLNSETLSWLSDDTKAWPSTSNLYSRLVAEIGWVGAAVYVAFRFLLVLGMSLRLLRKDNPDWLRDLAIFSTLVGLTVFDFHRDSFINLDVWTEMGLALVCLTEMDTVRAAGQVRGWSMRLFAGVTALCFCVSLALVLLQPPQFMASATLVAKSSGVLVGSGAGLDGNGLDVEMSGEQGTRFQLFRTYWGSRAAAARMIADSPDLVRTALRDDGAPSAVLLADYISANVTVLMANEQSTLTLQYRNADPGFAERFLSAAIEETDRAIAAASFANGDQATRFSRLMMRQPDLNAAMRQALLARTAAQEIQSSFDKAGENVSFDYVERPHVPPADISPQPAPALAFLLLIALFSAVLALGGRMLWLAAA